MKATEPTNISCARDTNEVAWQRWNLELSFRKKSWTAHHSFMCERHSRSVCSFESRYCDVKCCILEKKKTPFFFYFSAGDKHAARAQLELRKNILTINSVFSLFLAVLYIALQSRNKVLTRVLGSFKYSKVARSNEWTRTPVTAVHFLYIP